MRKYLKQLGGCRELIYMLAWRDIRVRYKQSVMGFLWAILMPLMIVGAGIMVRFGAAKWTGVPISRDDIASVIIRAVVWSFFIASLRFGTNSLISNGSLVTKIAFPKEVFPLAAVISSLFDFAVAAVAVVIILIVTGWTPTLVALWSLPLLAVLFALTLGMCLVLSAANLFFRDIKYVVEIILNYAIFFTPVLYEVEMVADWQNILFINPVAPLLEAIADSLVTGTLPSTAWIAYSCGVAAVSLVGGYWFFKQLESRFAESF